MKLPRDTIITMIKDLTPEWEIKQINNALIFIDSKTLERIYTVYISQKEFLLYCDNVEESLKYHSMGTIRLKLLVWTRKNNEDYERVYEALAFMVKEYLIT